MLISIFAFIFGVCQMLFAMGSIRRVRWPNLHQVMMLQPLCCQLPRPNCTNVFVHLPGPRPQSHAQLSV